MKKIITGLVLLISSYSLVFGFEEPKLNNKDTKRNLFVPDKQFYVGSEFWGDNIKFFGVRDFYDIPDEKNLKGDGEWDKEVGYIICKGEKSGYPFGLYDRHTRDLYLDNDSDGFVDETIQNPKKFMSKYAPDCP